MRYSSTTVKSGAGSPGLRASTQSLGSATLHKQTRRHTVVATPTTGENNLRASTTSVPVLPVNVVQRRMRSIGPSTSMSVSHGRPNSSTWSEGVPKDSNAESTESQMSETCSQSSGSTCSTPCSSVVQMADTTIMSKILPRSADNITGGFSFRYPLEMERYGLALSLWKEFIFDLNSGLHDVSNTDSGSSKKSLKLFGSNRKQRKLALKARSVMISKLEKWNDAVFNPMGMHMHHHALEDETLPGVLEFCVINRHPAIQEVGEPFRSSTITV
eukprot:Clim_evm3s213 gene=Clim_evmTU3s213